MAVFVSAIGEAKGFQIGDFIALLQVGLPGPGIPGGVILVVIGPEHSNHLVGKATSDGEVDPAPKLPHDGDLDI